MNFDEFQKQAKRTRVFTLRLSGDAGHQSELVRHYLLSGLMAQVGEIANRLKKKLRDGEDYVLLKDELSERIGYTMWYVAVFADELGLSLEEIAQANVDFNSRRWHQVAEEGSDHSADDLDASYPEGERLPRRLVAHFETRTSDGGLKKTTVRIYPKWPSKDGGQKFGDEIDDNSTTEDHYRYHDVYHLAYLAFLGWSPVVRKLLSCKRKSVPNVDRIEDGARARDTEEATTAFIYSYVSQQKFLATSSNIDTGLLTTVRTLLRAYEVRIRAEKEWEAAILAATSVLRSLVENEGGWVEADADNRSVTYLGKLEPEQGSK